MNEKQRTVVGAVAAALIIAGLFFAPWRHTQTGELTWAPVFRKPASYTGYYQGRESGSAIRYDDATFAAGIFALQLLGIGGLGWVAYVVSADHENEDEGTPA